MVAEGLLAYDKIEAAARLFSRNMDGVIRALKREKHFRAYYHTEMDISAGQRNHVIGLPPVSLFLEILGIRPLSATQILVMHKNPFPWPVKVCFRGTSVVCTSEQVAMQFPGGEETILTDELPCLIDNILVEVETEP